MSALPTVTTLAEALNIRCPTGRLAGGLKLGQVGRAAWTHGVPGVEVNGEVVIAMWRY